MCSPTLGLAAASLAITAAGAVSSFQGQKQQAKAQEDYQQQLADERELTIRENYARTIESHQANTIGETARIEEIKMASRQQQLDIRSQALLRGGTARAAAASRGSAGASVSAVLDDIMAQAGFDISRTQTNVGLEIGQSRRNLEAISREANYQAASIKPYTPSPISQVSLLKPVLQIGGAGVDAYTKYIRPEQKAGDLTT